MTDAVVDAILHEANWLPVAMAIAAITVVAYRRAAPGSPTISTLCALSLFYGVMLGTMTTGHLLAVTVTAARGTLQGSPWFLYPIGLGLTIPAWWLTATAVRLRRADPRSLTRVVGLHGWLGVGLIALGAHNWPIAAPAALNIAYGYHTKPAVGRMIVMILGVAYLGLFAGAVVFMASGQTFEEFQGIPGS